MGRGFGMGMVTRRRTRADPPKCASDILESGKSRKSGNWTVAAGENYKFRPACNTKGTQRGGNEEKHTNMYLNRRLFNR